MSVDCLFFMGDSITAKVGGYAAQMAAALNVPSINSADSGDHVPDQAWPCFSHVTLPNQASIIALGTNDADHYSGTGASAKRFLVAEAHLAMILHRAVPDSSPNKVRGRAMAASGSWSNLIDDKDIGGVYTTSQGATRSASVSGSTIVATINGYDNFGGQCSVEIDGTTFGPFPTNNPAIATGGLCVTDDPNRAEIPLTLMFDGLENRPHDVTITKTDAGGQLVAISNVMGFSGLPVEGPPVLVANSYQRTAAGWGAGTLTAAEVLAIRQRATLFNRAWSRNVAVARRLGLTKVVPWNWSGVINPATDLSDGKHPNAAGDAKLSASGLAILAALDAPIPADIALAAAISRQGFGPKEGAALSFLSEQIRAS